MTNIHLNHTPSHELIDLNKSVATPQKEVSPKMSQIVQSVQVGIGNILGSMKHVLSTIWNSRKPASQTFPPPFNWSSLLSNFKKSKSQPLTNQEVLEKTSDKAAVIEFENGKLSHVDIQNASQLTPKQYRALLKEFKKVGNDICQDIKGLGKPPEYHLISQIDHNLTLLRTGIIEMGENKNLGSEAIAFLKEFILNNKETLDTMDASMFGDYAPEDPHSAAELINPTINYTPSIKMTATLYLSAGLAALDPKESIQTSLSKAQKAQITSATGSFKSMISGMIPDFKAGPSKSLEEILNNPILKSSFESFLKKSFASENLIAFEFLTHFIDGKTITHEEAQQFLDNFSDLNISGNEMPGMQYLADRLSKVFDIPIK